MRKKGDMMEFDWFYGGKIEAQKILKILILNENHSKNKIKRLKKRLYLDYIVLTIIMLFLFIIGIFLLYSCN